MVNAAELRAGMVIRVEGEIYKVLEVFESRNRQVRRSGQDQTEQREKL